MKTYLSILGALLLAALLLSPGDLQASAEWKHALKKVLAKAEKEDKNIALVFTVANCRFCRELESEVGKSKQENTFPKGLVLAILPLDAPFPEKELRYYIEFARTLNIQAFPTTAVFNSKGEHLGDTLGFEKIDRYFDNINKIITPPAD